MKLSSNESWPDMFVRNSKGFAIESIMVRLVLSICAIPPSFLLVVISKSQPKTCVGRRYLIVNTAIAYLCLSAALVYEQSSLLVHHYSQKSHNLRSCSLQTIFLQVFGFCALYSQFLTSIGRYVGVKSKERMTRKQKFLFACVFTYHPILWLLIAYVRASSTPLAISPYCGWFSQFGSSSTNILHGICMALYVFAFIYCTVQLLKYLTKSPQVSQADKMEEKRILLICMATTASAVMLLSPELLVSALLNEENLRFPSSVETITHTLASVQPLLTTSAFCLLIESYRTSAKVTYRWLMGKQQIQVLSEPNVAMISPTQNDSAIEICIPGQQNPPNPTTTATQPKKNSARNFYARRSIVSIIMQ